MRVGRVEKYLMESIEDKGAVHMTLIDPAKTRGSEAGRIAEEAAKAGTTAIMVGGSIGVSEAMVDEAVLSIKERVGLPVILFPGTPTGLSRYADAVWFLSVLNSTNPYFIVIGQVQGAPIVKRYGLEALPLAYIVLGRGGTVGFISQARLIPFDKPEVAIAYSLAAQYMGFRFLYLEGGSGGDPVPPDIIEAVSRSIEIPVITGGGIRTPSLARRAVKAGADVIVTGTVVEEAGDIYGKLKPIISAMREAARERRGTR
ncbi:MAG TPA: geranylgeranylglyceryl/heptaprenylglyceryl phosphate synthase [Thermofilaceae archaeon]|nr:geranylgeranylglyceryl/heptaprenylglyceryl phosphate synthase [Thermofilaceae archaeon]